MQINIQVTSKPIDIFNNKNNTTHKNIKKFLPRMRIEPLSREENDDTSALLKLTSRNDRDRDPILYGILGLFG
jgi:hypothetical protein